MFESEEIIVAVKGYKIVESRQLMLYCDLCGSQMPSGVFKLPSPSPCSVTKDMVASDLCSDYFYEYTCQKCGHVQKSTMNYPCQQISFDYNDAKDLEDQGKVE